VIPLFLGAVEDRALMDMACTVEQHIDRPHHATHESDGVRIGHIQPERLELPCRRLATQAVKEVLIQVGGHHICALTQHRKRSRAPYALRCRRDQHLFARKSS
jgi:hypothetical protein